MAVKIDLEKCTGCGDCIEECPVECMKLENEKCIVDEEECTDCAVCIDICPENSISEEE
ncbi:indolepyruvate ferredoxin oxidoreductase subunit alpha [Fibrobacterota bacterium]